jgi:CBS-domain-containing membrane protein
MSRAGLPLHPRLLRALDAAERSPLIEQMADAPLNTLMTTETRCIYAGAPVPQALVSMLEWSYNALPVLDRAGQFAGLIDNMGVLRAALDASPTAGNVRDAEPPTLVRLVMQAHVPQASTTLSLSAVLGQLLATPQRYLVLVDAAGRVQGAISDTDALEGLHGDERGLLLAALRGETTTLPGDDRGPEVLLRRATPTLLATQSINEAIERFVSLNLERAPVVDEEGRLQGLLACGGLLRALAQAD